MSKKLLKSEKRVSKLMQKLTLEKEKVKIEKKKGQSLTEKLLRSNSSKSDLKKEVAELKNCQFPV